MTKAKGYYLTVEETHVNTHVIEADSYEEAVRKLHNRDIVDTILQSYRGRIISHVEVDKGPLYHQENADG